ncbi:MAG: LLM class flavin-dependent oxidoreductase [Beijerinckiaceae bacterium]|jgi:N-acetyl-S-(2-succino)cysteine monooxygenase|nr:LLM class flavin-dependent oxidoreductase [Beijerinckiaceae bacterium]MDO9441939.1 LLM class flavin-dependent oxidoreductase [Beijerinckiaceae bacterium]
MADKKKQIKLGFFIRPTGHHIGSWRHPDAQADAGVNFPHFVELAKTAERGLFDMIFSADTPTAFTAEEEHLHRTHYVAWIEPFTLLTALSCHTKNIGLVCTASTSFEEPFAIARRFASLDLVCNGRAGWNVVTTGNPAAAANFSAEPHLPKAERYKKAREFTDIVRGLWDSWDEDAFIRDRESGVFFDRSKMHILNHHGAYYDVRGPLNVARSPQGQPVIVQAGASDDGRDLAAETAEVVFTAHEELGPAREFYADVKGRMAKYGRHPEDLKIMPGLSVIVAKTRQEAQDKFQQLQDLIHPDIGLAVLSRKMGFDFSRFPIDGPVPDVVEGEILSSRVTTLIEVSRRDNLTIRQLYQKFCSTRGHFSLVGTPTDVVDQMAEWFEKGAADGFNFIAPWLPGGLDNFVDLVVPELQRRGLYRTAYEGKTLRDNLGLSVPVSRYAATAPKARVAAR